MNFSDLQLSEPVLRAIADLGYTTPTPIQEQAIPYVLMGRDVLGCAQTGTGKTASFTLPMIDILAAGRAKARMPRSLILEPTRELAAQVAEAFDLYGKHCRLSKALLIGGESMADQIRVLDRGADVLIATPGRLLDVFERGYLLLNDVKILVIDEADRMLDMGFIPDVEKISSIVSRMRQTLLFSATMPPPIRRLADAFLTNPKEVSVAPPATPAANVTQGIIVVHSTAGSGHGGLKEKRLALRTLIKHEDVRTALIFCNRKREVGVVCRSLQRHGFDAAMLHGDMAQSARTEVLERFRHGDIRLLVCSDVAARGLDIEDLSHVVNFDVPTTPDDYIHRIGRTARAGRSGRALTIALPEEGKYVALIEKMIGSAIPRLEVEGVEAAELSAPSGRRRHPGKAKTEPKRPEEKRFEAKRPDEEKRPEEKRPEEKRPEEKRAEEKRAEEKRPEAKRSQPRPEKRTAPAKAEAKRGAAKPRPPREPEPPVTGMGDHMPAFMLLEIKLPKKA
ncbi:MAG: DEAD/DEAH box helicase [Defluviicoccus sp.]